MSKKYLSLEEAAAVLKMGTDELIRLRERGGIRGFADRGTWKFREEDVQQVRRASQADSDPDVPLYSSDDDSAIGMEMEEELGEQPTVIRKGLDAQKSSDSEVKLVGDAGGLADESGELRPLSLSSDSDSDVKLVEPATDTAGDDIPMVDSGIVVAGGLESDSDVALVSESSHELNLGPLDDTLGSDSDVRLVADDSARGSDSDVKLVKPSDRDKTSDSDVALLREGDDAEAVDFTADETPGASVLSDESGIALTGDSAMLLQDESGVAFDDSNVVLGGDEEEGITLDIGSDSGISLETAADSGISLESVADSGISLEDSAEFGGTMPMMKALEPEKDETAYEIPSLAGDSAFELAAAESDNETAVFDLEDAESNLDDAVFDLDETADEDSFASDAFAEDDLEVADDILGEDDELDELDVFDADEDVFDEGMSPASQTYASPIGAQAVEQEWGAGAFAGLVVSTILMTLVGVVMLDLVNNIWSWNEPTAVSSMMLDSLRGLYSN